MTFTITYRTFKDLRRSSKSLIIISNKLIYLGQDSLNYPILYWDRQLDQEQKSHIVKIYALMESTKYHQQVNITIRFRLHQPYPSPMRQLIGQQLRHTTLILHCPAQQQARLQEMLYLQRVQEVLKPCCGHDASQQPHAEKKPSSSKKGSAWVIHHHCGLYAGSSAMVQPL